MNRHGNERCVEASALRTNGQALGRRSYMWLPSVVAQADGVPIYAFGRTFVYGVSPDFETGVVIQEGNRSKPFKIVPKRSWELGENHIGSMVSWQPRIPQNDLQPFLAINLIDGDPATCWCSRGQGQPTVEPVWIRLDLAKEVNLREIALVPSPDGQGIPRHLTIKISRDAWHWLTLHEGRHDEAPENAEPLRFPLKPPTPVKQIWIVGSDLPLVKIGRERHRVAEYHFMLAEVQAIDEDGENVALVSRGAGVTVSSTNYGQGSSWDVYDLMWPVQYDLGAKWMRLSGSNPPYHHDTLSWRFVEQEKGQYRIDPKTDLAITEAVKNGYQIIVMLTYGNWLYTPEPGNESLNARDFPRPFPPAPVTREGFEGYKNWVRFMVEHFKGRVAYWEIYNEPIGWGWEVIEDFDERVKVYCDLVKEVVPVIREADPEAKISLAGMAGVPGLPVGERTSTWLHKCLEHGVVHLVDAIGWHIQGSIIPESPAWKAYPGAVREFKRAAEARGFRGVYMASESWWGAPYPPHSEWAHPPHAPLPGLPPLTELRKAKDMARTYVMNLGLGVWPFWCNTWFDYTQNDGGLFRNTFSADPVSPTQPEPAYYVLRTLCTVMERAEPTELDVEFSNKTHDFDHWSFAVPENTVLVGVWLPGASVDRHPGVLSDVIIARARAGRVIAIDTLNGIEQELRFDQRGDSVIIPSVLVRDYPTMLKLIDVNR